MSNLWKRLRWVEGEGIDPNDFLDVVNEWEQRYTSLRRFGLAHQHIDGTGTLPTNAVYSSTPLGGTIAPGAGSLTIKNLAGFMYTGTPTAAQAYGAAIRPAFLEESDISATLSAGDATNPRIDLIEVRFLASENVDTESRDFEDAVTRKLTSTSTAKRTRMQFSFNVKEGTPAASPTMPTVTAGYFKWAAVYVPATFSGAFVEHTHLWDLRWPGGFFSSLVPGYLMAGITGTYKPHHAADATPGTISNTAGASGDDAVAIPLAGVDSSSAARLVGVTFARNSGTNPELVYATMNSGAALGVTSYSPVVTLSGGNYNMNVLTTDDRPYWANGAQHPVGLPSGVRDQTSIAIQFPADSSADPVGMARFYFAGFSGGAY